MSETAAAAVPEEVPVKTRRIPVRKPMVEIKGLDTPYAEALLHYLDSAFARSVVHVVHDKLGYHALGHSSKNGVFSLQALATIREDLQRFFETQSWTTVDGLGWTVLLEALNDYAAAGQQRYEENHALGRAEFWDLPLMLKKGAEVATHFTTELVGGKIIDAEIRYTHAGVPFVMVKLSVVHNYGGKIEEGEYGATVPYFAGYSQLTDLPVCPVSAHQRELLVERGKKFQEFCTRVSYVAYSGQLVQSSWWSERSYRADGRMMIDVGTFKQVDAEQARKEVNESRLLNVKRRDEDEEGTAFELTDEDLWRCYPFTCGFSFSAKQWGRVAVSGLRPIAWREDAYDQLVLDEERKEMARALVEHQGGSFTDIIEGKGGGTIFLLHGPPGEGKTLTAEAIAELLKRPLYSISVGELGVEPSELEERLRVVLDIATIWNAVVLIDEADIFLEERDEHNVLRNAMVGVFLRLLEYHQGVLFLTTNRVKKIDRAFLSRISVLIKFKKGTLKKRRQVWKNLLGAAQLTDAIELDTFDNFDLNGRQIKNVIRQSQTLAKAREVEVSTELMLKVVELTSAANADWDTDD